MHDRDLGGDFPLQPEDRLPYVNLLFIRYVYIPEHMPEVHCCY